MLACFRMFMTPQVPIPDPTPASNRQEMRDALEFARETARGELDSIDRIHQRTVRYILAVVTVLLAGGTILGWIGFKNLEDSAINSATKQLQDETTKQVQQKLTQENLSRIVATRVGDFARNQLTAEINRQIAAGSLHDQILRTAREQSQRELSSVLAARKLTEQQAATLTRAVSRDKELQGRLFFVTALTYDVESQHYGKEISDALEKAGVQLGYRNNLAPPDSFDYGITLVYDQDLPGVAALAKKLLAIFESVGIRPKFVGGKEIDAEGETIKPVFTIWVGPRDLTPRGK